MFGLVEEESVDVGGRDVRSRQVLYSVQGWSFHRLGQRGSGRQKE